MPKLIIGSTTIEPWRIPPVQGIPVRRARGELLPSSPTNPELILHYGTDETAGVRIVSSPNQGFLTTAEADAIRTLYYSLATTGGSFSLVTDMFGEGEKTYTAFFMPGVDLTFPPVPAPPLPGYGKMYFFDLTLRVKPA